MLLKNSKLLTVAMMVLCIVTQSAVSAAVSTSMMGSKSIPMEQDEAPCHQADVTIASTESGPQMAKVGDGADLESGDCCQIDCSCVLGQCSSAALPINQIPNGQWVARSQENHSIVQWPPSLLATSLYRPPISL